MSNQVNTVSRVDTEYHRYKLFVVRDLFICFTNSCQCGFGKLISWWYEHR